MDLRLQHAVIRTSDIAIAKEFYLGKLGLEVLEEAKNFFAAKAGAIRLSFFEGYEMQQTGEDVKTGISLILRVDNLIEAREYYSNRGINFLGEIIDIPKFHKFLEFEDPFGNVLFLAEYEVEPV